MVLTRTALGATGGSGGIGDGGTKGLAGGDVGAGEGDGGEGGSGGDGGGGKVMPHVPQVTRQAERHSSVPSKAVSRLYGSQLLPTAITCAIKAHVMLGLELSG